MKIKKETYQVILSFLYLVLAFIGYYILYKELGVKVAFSIYILSICSRILDRINKLDEAK